MVTTAELQNNENHILSFRMWFKYGLKGVSGEFIKRIFFLQIIATSITLTLNSLIINK